MSEPIFHLSHHAGALRVERALRRDEPILVLRFLRVPVLTLTLPLARRLARDLTLQADVVERCVERRLAA